MVYVQFRNVQFRNCGSLVLSRYMQMFVLYPVQVYTAYELPQKLSETPKLRCYGYLKPWHFTCRIPELRDILQKEYRTAYHVRLHVWGPIMGRLLLKQMTKVGQSRAGCGSRAPETFWRWEISAGETAAGASDHWILYEALHLLADLQVPLAASPRNIPKPGGK